MDNSVKRGDIFYADLSPVVGSEQGGVRPVLIVQNDTGNRHSPTVIAAARAAAPKVTAAVTATAAAISFRFRFICIGTSCPGAAPAVPRRDGVPRIPV